MLKKSSIVLTESNGIKTTESIIISTHNNSNNDNDNNHRETPRIDKINKYCSWLHVLQEKQLRQKTTVKQEQFEILSENKLKKSNMSSLNGIVSSESRIQIECSSNNSNNSCINNKNDNEEGKLIDSKMPDLERRQVSTKSIKEESSLLRTRCKNNESLSKLKKSIPPNPSLPPSPSSSQDVFTVDKTACLGVNKMTEQRRNTIDSTREQSFSSNRIYKSKTIAMSNHQDDRCGDDKPYILRAIESSPNNCESVLAQERNDIIKSQIRQSSSWKPPEYEAHRGEQLINENSSLIYESSTSLFRDDLSDSAKKPFKKNAQQSESTATTLCTFKAILSDKDSEGLKIKLTTTASSTVMSTRSKGSHETKSSPSLQQQQQNIVRRRRPQSSIPMREENPYKKPRRDFRNEAAKSCPSSDQAVLGDVDSTDDYKSNELGVGVKSQKTSEDVNGLVSVNGKTTTTDLDVIKRNDAEENEQEEKAGAIVADPISDLDEDALEIDTERNDSPSPTQSDATDICESEWTTPKNPALKKNSTEERSETIGAALFNKSPISPLILKRGSPKSEFKFRFKSSDQNSPNNSDAIDEESVDQTSREQASNDQTPSDQTSRDQKLSMTHLPSPPYSQATYDVAVASRFEGETNDAVPTMKKRKKINKSPGTSMYISENESCAVLNQELGPMYNWLENKIKNYTPLYLQRRKTIGAINHLNPSLEEGKVEKEITHSDEELNINVKIEPISVNGLDLSTQDSLIQPKNENLSNKICYDNPQNLDQIKLDSDNLNGLIQNKMLAVASEEYDMMGRENNDIIGRETMSFQDREINISCNFALRQKYEILKRLSYISEQKDQEIARIEAEKQKLKMEIFKAESIYKDLQKNTSSSKIGSNFKPTSSEMINILMQKNNSDSNLNTQMSQNVKGNSESPTVKISYNAIPLAHTSRNYSPFSNPYIITDFNDAETSKTRSALDLSLKNTIAEEDEPKTKSSDRVNCSEAIQDVYSNDPSTNNLSKIILPKSKSVDSSQTQESVNESSNSQTPLNLTISEKELINQYISKHDLAFNTKLKELSESLKNTAELSIFLQKIISRLHSPFIEVIMRFIDEENIYKVLNYANESVRKFFQNNSTIIEAFNRTETDNNATSSDLMDINCRDATHRPNINNYEKLYNSENLNSLLKFKETDCYILDSYETTRSDKKLQHFLEHTCVDNTLKKTSNNSGNVDTEYLLRELIDDKTNSNKNNNAQSINNCNDWIKESCNNDNNIMLNNLSNQDSSTHNNIEKNIYPLEKLKNSIKLIQSDEENKKIEAFNNYINKNNDISNLSTLNTANAKTLHEKLMYQQSLHARDASKANLSRQNTVEAQVLLQQIISKTDERVDDKITDNNQYYISNSSNNINSKDQRLTKSNDLKLNHVLKPYTQINNNNNSNNNQTLDTNYPVMRTFVRYQQIPSSQSLNQVINSLQSIQVPPSLSFGDQTNLSYVKQQQSNYVTSQNSSFKPATVESVTENLVRQQMQQQIKFRQQRETLAELSRKHQAMTNRVKLNGRIDQQIILQQQQQQHQQQQQRNVKNGAAPESPLASDNLCAICSQPAHFVCSACRKISYCSRECQATSWEKQHKNFCKIQS